MDTIGTMAGLSRATWRKSSYSGGGGGGNCVEVAHIPTWRKSSYSGGNGSACVEVAHIPGWRKSSYSGGSGSNCVEVGAWRKSSHSGGGGSSSSSECVEVGEAGYAIAVRDSKDPDGPSLLVSPIAWAAFAGKIKSGRPLI
ncbi:MAG TPA: DUF397 domain-containing protein [Streptosporangiaceae bacterium]|nr:DUF397 domain-containing protein [Streptosporangiaceae bacterium]